MYNIRARGVSKNFEVAWKVVFSSLVILFCVSLFFSMKFADRAPTFYEEYKITILGEVLLLFPIAYGFRYLDNKIRYTDLISFKRTPLGFNILAVLATVGAQYFITLLTLPLQSFLIILFGAETTTSKMSVPTDFSQFMLAFFTLCIVAPVIEEILCRGLLVRLFKRYGIVVALIGSSIAFTMLHFEIRSCIQIFFMGLLFGAVRIFTDSVFSVIIMHSANNLLTLIQMLCIENGIVTPFSLIIASVFLFVISVYLMFTIYRRKYLPIKMLYRVSVPYFSTSAWCSVLVFLFYNFMLLVERLINL